MANQNAKTNQNSSNNQKNPYNILLSEVRQQFASVVWTHKIQEKQADIYKSHYSCMQTINIFLAALTSAGIISTVFSEEKCELLLKVATAIVSFGTLFITSYQKAFNLADLSKQHKDSANGFLVIRNRMIGLIGEIHMMSTPVDELKQEYKDITERLNQLYLEAPSTTDEAVDMASKALNDKEDYTYSDEEIDRFLPTSLKGNIP